MGERLIAYFGYGSLVNVETLDTEYVSAAPARLCGWRRHWQSRIKGRGRVALEDLALLSVHPHEETEIDGMLVIDRAEHLPFLDEREAHYERVVIDRDQLWLSEELNELEGVLPEDLFVYVGLPNEQQNPPLVHSYLDTVMHGFLTAHGEAGLMRFLQTTSGFARAIIEDRDDPVYSRAVTVDDETKEWFDRLLVEAGVRFGNKVMT